MIEIFDKRYPDGSDLTLLNTLYHRPRKNENTGRWTKGSIDIIARDMSTGKKICRHITNPQYEFYRIKDEYMNEAKKEQPNGRSFLCFDMDKVETVQCPYSDVKKYIAQSFGMEDAYYDNLRNGKGKDNDKFLLANNFLRADMNICDFYRYSFAKKYKNNPYALKKAFFDIETDIAKAADQAHIQEGEVPINAITLMLPFKNECYTFLLETKDNPLIQQFKASVGPQTTVELLDTICKSMGGDKENLKKFELTKMKFHLSFYPEEKEIFMIYDFFQLLNNSDADFAMAWNMRFDVPNLIARISRLGYDPREIVCDKRMTDPLCEFVVDYNNDLFEQRGDRADISSTVVYMCQLITFASRRKGRARQSMKLDDVAFKTVGVHKHSYSDLTDNIGEFPYLDYKRFVFYNIIDVVAQHCIEFKVKDIDYIFTKSLDTDTRYSKIHRQTVYQENAANKFFENELHLVRGNNANKVLRNPKASIAGAYVSNPFFILDDYKIRMDRYPLKAFYNVMDEDFKSMYPSEGINFNMGPNTQIGKIDIKDKIWDDEQHLNDMVNVMNPKRMVKYNRGGSYVEDLSSRDWLAIGHRWYGFPDFKEMFRLVMKYLSTVQKNDYDLYDIDHNPIVKNYSEDSKERLPFVIIDGKYNIINKPVMKAPFTIVQKPISDEVKEKIINERRQFIELLEKRTRLALYQGV